MDCSYSFKALFKTSSGLFMTFRMDFQFMSLERFCESLGKNHAYSKTFVAQSPRGSCRFGRELTTLTFYGYDACFSDRFYNMMQSNMKISCSILQFPGKNFPR